MAMKIKEKEALTITKEIKVDIWNKITTEDKGMIEKEARALIKINIPDLIEIDRNKEGLMVIDTDIQKEWEETKMKEKKRDSEIKKKDVAEADKKALKNTSFLLMDIRGKVVDSNGETLPGVSVRVKGSAVGTTTSTQS